MRWLAYYRLMRFHKPVGILLLWLPTAWALWLAHHGAPPLRLVLYFLLGTLFMRASGCVVNDIADRHIDQHVHRTARRPLTTGEVSLPGALLVLFMLLLAALFIVVQLPAVCFYYALAALFITILYPFCKRFFAAPQLVLGVAFSMGIPMAYAASGILFNSTMMLLFLLNFAWIVAYDTMYAMVDKEDDLRIGVKSTAILFARYDASIILVLQLLVQALWFLIALREHYALSFYAFWISGWIPFIYQQWLIRQSDTQAYFRAFSSNVVYGLLMWAGLF